MKTLVSTPSDREVAVSRSFAAPRALVFEAFTTPAFVRRWLLGPPGWTMPVCEIDFRVGGRYRYVWRHETDGGEMGMGGVFHEIEAPARYVALERFDEDWTGGDTQVTTTFAERAGATRVTITVLYASPAARDGALKTGMTEGMNAGFDRLEDVLGAMQA